MRFCLSIFRRHERLTSPQSRAGIRLMGVEAHAESSQLSVSTVLDHDGLCDQVMQALLARVKGNHYETD